MKRHSSEAAEHPDSGLGHVERSVGECTAWHQAASSGEGLSAVVRSMQGGCK